MSKALRLYSAIASVSAQRPVLLADAFVYNSNEADSGKVVWEKSTKENLKIFTQRLFKLRDIPARFARQVYNLWTPNSFPIFRLLNSEQRYNNVQYPRLIAYFSAGMYILVVISGFIGMCCAEKNLFQIFTVANLLLLLCTGLFFLMCSRFRIPFMYLFILYGSAMWSDLKSVRRMMTWQRISIFGLLLVVFVDIIISKRTSFGFWG